MRDFSTASPAIQGGRRRPTALWKSLVLLFPALTALTWSTIWVDGGDADRPSHFQFTRVRFNSYHGGWRSGWAQDYPRADRNFLNILAEVTGIQTTPDSFSVVDLGSPEIMHYPLLYFSEPGGWDITPDETVNFREYLSRGGFAIFDDFDGPRDWTNFQRCMKEVLPELNLARLTVEHPIFNCFFEIETLEVEPPAYIRGKPEFYGLMRENGNLQVVANFNNDIGDFWEWSGESLYPINLSNEAYKFGVNYVIYALTH